MRSDTFYKILSLLLMLPLWLWEGYVLSKLWGWHVVDYFGVKPISVTMGMSWALVMWGFLGFTTWGRQFSEYIQKDKLGLELLIDTGWEFALPGFALVGGSILRHW